MPYITEEIYHLYFDKIEGKKSIHVSDWPKLEKDFFDQEAEQNGDMAVGIITAARKFKSERKLSLKEHLKEIIIECQDKEKLQQMIPDIQATTRADSISFGDAETQIAEGLKIRIVE